MFAGFLGLSTFPLAGFALIARVLDPLAFVTLSMAALAVLGVATMKLHRDDDFLTPQ